MFLCINPFFLCSMDNLWKFLVTASFVLAAACFLGYQVLRAWYPKPNCHEGSDPKNRDLCLERYQHLNSEIGRYRDLSWKIAVLAWAADYVVFIDLFSQSGGNVRLESFYNPSPEQRMVLLALISLVATVFILFCERMTKNNQALRRDVEATLDLPNAWRHHATQESSRRFGFLLSVSAFIGFIWFPTLLTCWFCWFSKNAK